MFFCRKLWPAVGAHLFKSVLGFLKKTNTIQQKKPSCNWVGSVKKSKSALLKLSIQFCKTIESVLKRNRVGSVKNQLVCASRFCKKTELIFKIVIIYCREYLACHSFLEPHDALHCICLDLVCSMNIKHGILIGHWVISNFNPQIEPVQFLDMHIL